MEIQSIKFFFVIASPCKILAQNCATHARARARTSHGIRWIYEFHWNLLFLCSAGETWNYRGFDVAFMCHWHEITVSNYSVGQSDRHTKCLQYVVDITMLVKTHKKKSRSVGKHQIIFKRINVNFTVYDRVCAVRIVSYTVHNDIA